MIKNFLNTIRRFKVSSTLNALGLSFAFAAFIIILIQVRYELTFDAHYPKSRQIYRMETTSDKGASYLAAMSRPAIDLAIQSSATIESGTLISGYVSKKYYNMELGGQKVGFKAEIEKTYPASVDVFGFEFVEGSDTDFVSSVAETSTSTNVIVPQSLAERVFGDQPAVGKTFFDTDRGGVYSIVGVYKDFPASSSIKNVVKVAMAKNADNIWGNNNYAGYVVLHPGTPKEDAERDINAEFADRQMSVRLTPIEDIYYQTGVKYDNNPKGDRATTMILLSVALLVICIAAINFVNFSVALIPVRVKSINTKKILGSSVAAIRTSLVFETIGLSIVAFLLSLFWVSLLGKTAMANWVMTPIDLGSNWEMVLLSLGVALVLGTFVGIYPSIYATSFSPALALKGAFSLSTKGRVLRTGLIGFQFVISIGLIVVAIFMQLQNRFMRNYNPGFDTEQIAVVETPLGILPEVLKTELSSSALIKDVAFCFEEPIGTADVYMGWGRTFGDKNFTIRVLPVSRNFPEMLGLEIIEGRTFTEDDNKKGGAYIFNQKAMKEFELEVSQKGKGHGEDPVEIVGVAKDFNYSSLRKEIEPAALYLFDTNPWELNCFAYVKIGGDLFAAVDHITTVIKRMDPAYPVDVRFVDQMIDATYRKERNVSGLIGAFSALAIVISLMGVFGLVMFETQHRRKEIGVRRVLGASVDEILMMFNKNFLKIVGVSVLIAVPIAYYGTEEWLSSFAYKTQMYWWVFVVGVLVVTLITIATVTLQSYRTATENPVNSLKSE